MHVLMNSSGNVGSNGYTKLRIVKKNSFKIMQHKIMKQEAHGDGKSRNQPCRHEETVSPREH